MPPFFQTYVGLKTICKFTTKLEQEKELTPGLGTFCPPTADGGAKAGFKVQRLSPGSGAVLPDKPASYGRFGFKTCKSLGEGNHLKVAMSEGSPLL